ncbi:LOW QUALITY PROTEIN: transcription elongation factor A protein-like 8 [Phyllostomus discolor]|uniref:LOW QUALITY PROTEIN: transcription elongation factor A protein-like 8 n=1 Tax=Phyllostomus discolor TaxID=89673 RepID=A0A7E6E9C1_9CHIR|nr:LOW QUALITY PROTEIN: transcription elongation factor A protein-like 8 [Phyllostomus discolor]
MDTAGWQDSGSLGCDANQVREGEKSPGSLQDEFIQKGNNGKIFNVQESCEENEGKPQNVPNAEEGRPLEDVPQEAEGNPQPSQEGVSQEAEGNLRHGLTQPVQGFKEDSPSPIGYLDPEEMLRGAEELERLREASRRARNKFVMMHWKQRHSCRRPYPVRLGRGFFFF